MNGDERVVHRLELLDVLHGARGRGEESRQLGRELFAVHHLGAAETNRNITKNPICAASAKRAVGIRTLRPHRAHSEVPRGHCVGHGRIHMAI